MNTKINPDAVNHCIKETSFSNFSKTTGKVRDIFDLDKRLLLVTTDRLSAFDRFVTTIPYKGEVLNSISQYWFEQTRHIASNHMIACPYSNAMMVKKLNVLPIEFIVRGYITGSTKTSLWTLYQQGERTFDGITLKDGLKKNEKLEQPILTPTTKSDLGDHPISEQQIVERNLMTQAEFNKAKDIVLSLYNFANDMLEGRDLILVDSKFEIARDDHGNLIIVDEMMTPDSSRYWRNSNYMSLQEKGIEPDNFDKEKIRLWLNDQCDPYQSKRLPNVPDALRIEVAEIYINLYEMITQKPFKPSSEVFKGSFELLTEA